MALINAKETFSAWGISKFPTCLKSEFKKKCIEEKKDMVEILKKVVRQYVEESQQMYIDKQLATSVDEDLSDYTETKYWGIRSFPIKLKADFKCCCASRGDDMVNALIYLTKEWING
jgi:hypothetical protein